MYSDGFPWVMFCFFTRNTDINFGPGACSPVLSDSSTHVLVHSMSYPTSGHRVSRLDIVCSAEFDSKERNERYSDGCTAIAMRRLTTKFRTTLYVPLWRFAFFTNSPQATRCNGRGRARGCLSPTAVIWNVVMKTPPPPRCLEIAPAGVNTIVNMIHFCQIERSWENFDMILPKMNTWCVSAFYPST